MACNNSQHRGRSTHLYTTSLSSYFWQSNYNWVVDRRNMPVENLIRSQLQSEEEFTEQRSSHFKLCIAVNFKSLQKKSTPDFDLPFGTVMTKLKLFHVVERKMYQTRDKLPFVNSTKSLTFDLMKILMPKRLVRTYFLIAKVMHYQILLQN